MKTIKLYETDGMCREFTANVLSCTKNGDYFHVILDQTAFFPEGGGQTCDTGTLGGARVLDTQLRDGEILHITDAEVTGTVVGALDFEERFRKMQNHLGEHLLCGVIHRRFGLTNNGFHLGADYMTCDIDGVLTDKEIDEVEYEANLAVFADAPVLCYTPDAKTLETLSYRAKSEMLHGDAVRIVEAVGYDICACCAPHLDRTGKVGSIKIVERMKHRGGMRFFVHCGIDALIDHVKKQKELETVSALLSAKQGNVPAYVRARLDEIISLKQTISAYRRELVASRLASLAPTSGHLLFFEHTLDKDSLRPLADGGLPFTSGISAAFSGADKTGYHFVLSSKAVALRPFAEKLALLFCAKFGGTDQAIFGHIKATEAEIRAFFDDSTIG